MTRAVVAAPQTANAGRLRLDVVAPVEADAQARVVLAEQGSLNQQIAALNERSSTPTPRRNRSRKIRFRAEGRFMQVSGHKPSFRRALSADKVENTPNMDAKPRNSLQDLMRWRREADQVSGGLVRRSRDFLPPKPQLQPQQPMMPQEQSQQYRSLDMRHRQRQVATRMRMPYGSGPRMKLG